jgi:hypothetical protein
LLYENATSGKAAVEEMQKLLRGFGASNFGLMEDFEHGEMVAQFTRRERPVTTKASAKGYAAVWLKHHPWSNQMRKTKIEHERSALKQAQLSVYSILRDWIKGQITAVEVGMLWFEGAFLGQLLLQNGDTVLERVTNLSRVRLAAPQG